MAVQDGKALSEALCAADGDLESIPRMFNDLRYNNIRCHQRMEAVGPKSHDTVYCECGFRGLCLMSAKGLFG